MPLIAAALIDFRSGPIAWILLWRHRAAGVAVVYFARAPRALGSAPMGRSAWWAWFAWGRRLFATCRLMHELARSLTG